MPYDHKLKRWRSMNEICDEGYREAIANGDGIPSDRPNLNPLTSDVDEEQADWDGDAHYDWDEGEDDSKPEGFK